MANSGFIKLKLIQTSPDLQWIQENYDSEVTEEPEYVYTDSKDRRCVKLDLYFSDSEDNIRKYSILLVDQEVISKSDAYLYVNSTGDNQWAKTSSGLWSNFIAWEKILSWSANGKVTERYVQGAVPHEKEVIEDKKFRISVRGEADLLDYVKNYANHSPYDTTVDLLPNLENLFNGDFKYVQNLISSDPSDICAFIYIDEQGNEQIYKHFLPKQFMIFVNSQMKQGSLDKSLKKVWESFKKSVENDLGELDYELQKYGPLRNIKAVITETNSEY